MSVVKAFFGLGKLPKVVKFFEFQSFDDVNKMGGAIRAIREEARTSGAQLTKSQQKYLDDQQRQVEMVFEQLQQPTTQTGIRGTQSAKIIDMQGKEIPKGSKIMGGQAVDDKMIDDAIENTSPGFAKGDTKYNAELVAEDLAERMGLVYDDLDTKQRIDIYGKAYDRLSKRNFQVKQTEKQIFERLNKENKQAVGNIRKKNLKNDISKLDDKIEARKLQLEQRGVEDFETDDLFNKLNEQRNDLELKLEFEDMVGPAIKKDKSRVDEIMDDMKEIEDPDDFATGGRVGLKTGMSKRAFLKLMGGAAAGIGALKTGALKMFGKGAAPVVEKTAEAASGAPSYFFDLVEKIKLLGVKSKGFKERSESFRYKDYDMDIDYDTGDIQIKKTKEAMIPGGDEAGIAEESIMVYRPGRADELTKGKTPPDEYDEFTARPDMDGKMKDVDDGLSENVQKQIIKEVLGDAPSIKKTGGGIARMLGE